MIIDRRQAYRIRQRKFLADFQAPELRHMAAMMRADFRQRRAHGNYLLALWRKAWHPRAGL